MDKHTWKRYGAGIGRFLLEVLVYYAIVFGVGVGVYYFIEYASADMNPHVRGFYEGACFMMVIDLAVSALKRLRKRLHKPVRS